jgi:hypothetical protein
MKPVFEDSKYLMPACRAVEVNASLRHGGPQANPGVSAHHPLQNYSNSRQSLKIMEEAPRKEIGFADPDPRRVNQD